VLLIREQLISVVQVEKRKGEWHGQIWEKPNVIL
jgi:hypothetical protein